MKIEWLHILDAIVLSPSLNEAAKRLHKSQPALTMAIKKLEAELGFEVLDRSQYRLTLTRRGHVYYREAKRLLSEVRQLDVLAKELALGNEARFRICYEQICNHPDYNRVIQSAFHDFPGTDVSVVSGKRFLALEQVNSGEAELGIGPWFDLFHATGELESLPVGQLSIGVVAAPALIRGETVSYDELQRLPCVAISESGLSFDNERLSFAASANVMKIDDIVTMKSFLLSAAGWGLIGLQHCQTELDSGALKRVRVSDREDEFGCEIRVFRKHSRHHGPVSRRLWSAFEALSMQRKGG